MPKPARAAARAALLAVLLATPAGARADEHDSALMSFRVLKPEVALELALAALEHCRAAGYQVTVAVVDRFGLQQVVLRDRFAGPHTIDTATRKAWTAVSFRASTLELSSLPERVPNFRNLGDITNALLLGGGVPVTSAGSVVGGVGVSGAPGPEIDDECAAAGIEAVALMLEF